ncbi:hypothetical protein IIB49_01780 [Patescibacteria group bacterium]|nr:hypothetical protein [Patescibacteria group bacterium]
MEIQVWGFILHKDSTLKQIWGRIGEEINRLQLDPKFKKLENIMRKKIATILLPLATVLILLVGLAGFIGYQRGQEAGQKTGQEKVLNSLREGIEFSVDFVDDQREMRIIFSVVGRRNAPHLQGSYTNGNSWATVLGESIP